ncbi:MAG: hypothetical protein ACYDDA_05225 [Acidiferrobacteraceae bacterium]
MDAAAVAETELDLWIDACRQEYLSGLTRQDWDVCAQRWRAASEAAKAAGHPLDAEVYEKLAKEAERRHENR